MFFKEYHSIKIINANNLNIRCSYYNERIKKPFIVNTNKIKKYKKNDQIFLDFKNIDNIEDLTLILNNNLIQNIEFENSTIKFDNIINGSIQYIKAGSSFIDFEHLISTKFEFLIDDKSLISINKEINVEEIDLCIQENSTFLIKNKGVVDSANITMGNESILLSHKDLYINKVNSLILKRKSKIEITVVSLVFINYKDSNSYYENSNLKEEGSCFEKYKIFNDLKIFGSPSVIGHENLLYCHIDLNIIQHDITKYIEPYHFYSIGDDYIYFYVNKLNFEYEEPYFFKNSFNKMTEVNDRLNRVEFHKKNDRKLRFEKLDSLLNKSHPTDHLNKNNRDKYKSILVEFIEFDKEYQKDENKLLKIEKLLFVLDIKTKNNLFLF